MKKKYDHKAAIFKAFYCSLPRLTFFLTIVWFLKYSFFPRLPLSLDSSRCCDEETILWSCQFHLTISSTR